MTISAIMAVAAFSRNPAVPWIPGIDCLDVDDISDLIPPEGTYVDPGYMIETTCGMAMVGYRLVYGVVESGYSNYCLYTANINDRCYLNQTSSWGE